MAYAFPAGRRMFFLRELGEPAEGSLRLIITEASITDFGTGILLGERAEMGLIDADDAKPSLELIWEHYVSYAVQSESFFIVAENSDPSSMLVEYHASPFLNYVSATTFAADIVGELRHWELSCMNHVIQVVSTRPPQIALLPAGGSYPIR
jgi:hypothetical protein